MTGRARFRRTIFGKLVLQYEARTTNDAAMGETSSDWHDCREDDLWRLRSHRETYQLEPLI